MVKGKQEIAMTMFIYTVLSAEGIMHRIFPI